MRSLFFKIFLWFWLAMMLIAGSVLVVTKAAAPDPLLPSQTGRVASILGSQTRRAINAYEEGGQKALIRELARTENRFGARYYLFDTTGKELRTGEPPPEIKRLRDHAKAAGPIYFETSGNEVLTAYRARGKQSTYLLTGRLSRGLMHAARRDDHEFPLGVQALRWLTVLLVAGAVCYGLARYIASPVEKLSDATHRFANGDLSVRVGPQLGKRRDELAELGHDFDRMAARIETLVNNQQQLLRDISHELRSPLARLRLALELARRDAVEKQTSPLNRIEKESERLDALIGQLLLLTRLENREAALKKTDFDLAQLAREVVADATIEAQSQQKTVVFETEETSPGNFHGSREILRSALENLVRNALQHTPENSSVAVTLQGTTLRVCDDGTGVPEEDVSRLFEPFYQVESSRGHEGGVGLGLAIVKRAALLHGGKVSARNRESGGLCIEIELPKA